MLNLGKERFIGNIVLKCSFQVALMSVKNLFNNKLARKNILCFINSISILVILTYCSHYSYSCSYYSSYCYYHYYFYYYYHYYYYYFIVIILVLSTLLILFYFILFFIVHITVIFVCVSPRFLFFLCFVFLVTIHSIYSHCSYISSMSYLSSSLSFSFFFNTTSHWGRIQRMNSSGMVYPYPLITLGKP